MHIELFAIHKGEMKPENGFFFFFCTVYTEQYAASDLKKKLESVRVWCYASIIDQTIILTRKYQFNGKACARTRAAEKNFWFHTHQQIGSKWAFYNITIRNEHRQRTVEMMSKKVFYIFSVRVEERTSTTTNMWKVLRSLEYFSISKKGRKPSFVVRFYSSSCLHVFFLQIHWCLLTKVCTKWSCRIASCHQTLDDVDGVSVHCIIRAILWKNITTHVVISVACIANLISPNP